MLLNGIEKALMNNPLRAAVQRHIEVRQLKRMGGSVPGGLALEVGCGRGTGTKLILDEFDLDRVDAFDLDPHMIGLAHKRLGAESRLRFWVGDVERIQALDNRYDAVFDFGILHHVARWRNAVSEIHRVLKPGGRFYAEEVLDRFILNPLVRRLLDHPLENRFNARGFAEALAGQGFEVTSIREIGGIFAWFVARKPATSPEACALGDTHGRV